MDYETWVLFFQALWADYWPIIYDAVFDVPPILWILLGVAGVLMLLPRRRDMTQEDKERQLVADEILNLLQRLAEEGLISWKRAEREMLRLGRTHNWSDFRVRRLKEYQLTTSDIAELKGRIKAHLGNVAGPTKPIPGDPPGNNNKKVLSGGKIGQLIWKRSQRTAPM